PIYHHLSFVHKTKDVDGDHVFDQLIYELDYWYVSPILLTFVRNLRDTKFTLDRNQDDLWFEDARNLIAGFFMCQSVCLSTLRSLVAMGERDGFIWVEKKPHILSADDSLFLETWKIHGSVFRYGIVREGRAETEAEVLKML